MTTMSLPVTIGVLVVGIAALGLVTFFLLRSTGSRRTRSRDRGAIVREANRALAQNPRDSDALSALADIYFKDQEWDKAANTYAVLLDLVAASPMLDEHEITFRHGLASMQLNRYEDAYKSLVLARRGHEDIFEINFNLGHLELLRRNYERAVNLLRAAKADRPEHLPTTRYLGQAFYRIKRYTEAVGLLRQIAEVEPDDKESIFVLGQTYYELGQNELASKVFGHPRADPVYGPRAALMAGSLHLKSRLYDEAELDFQIGLRHEDVPPEILLELKYRLAATYTRQQRLEKALQELIGIQQINPNYKDVGTQVERSRELMGNKSLQTFLMAPTSEFVGLCRRIVGSYFKDSSTRITDINVSRTEFADVLAEVHTAKWEDVVLFRFVRTSGAIGELVMRDLHARIKDDHAGRGFCISAGTYTEEAKEFVEARLIDLVDNDELAKLFKRI